MVSLDIESLFTNVPVAETLDIIINQLFPATDSIYHEFTKSDFFSLLKLAVDDSYFSFDNQLYKQVEGMAMGSPLGPIFANIFLSYHERSWLQACPIQPLLYRRYVDDTLWLLPPNSDLNQLMSFMNSRHPNMHFTHELESNNSINFIGLTITHSPETPTSHRYSTGIYRKPTFTGLFTNFHSFTCLSYRLSVIRSLTYRALRLCSNVHIFTNTLLAIKNFLMKNSYPSYLINKIFKSTLASLTNSSRPFGPEKEKLYIGLPYLGKNRAKIKQTFKSIF